MKKIISLLCFMAVSYLTSMILYKCFSNHLLAIDYWVFRSTEIFEYHADKIVPYFLVKGGIFLPIISNLLYSKSFIFFIPLLSALIFLKNVEKNLLTVFVHFNLAWVIFAFFAVYFFFFHVPVVIILMAVFFNFIFALIYSLKMETQLLHKQQKLNKHALSQKEMVNAFIEKELEDLNKNNAFIVHEFGKSIHNVNNCVKYIADIGKEHDSIKEFSQLAIQEIERMEGLGKQILDYHKDSASQKKICNVNNLLKDLIKISQKPFHDKNIKLKIQLDTNIPEISCYPDKLKQVFINLIANADDAMPHGGELEIFSKKEENNVRIVFKDSGSGIPEGMVNKIFKTFFTTKEDKGGSGIGLSTCTRILKLHGGSIKCHSNFGKGTRFDLLIPLS